MAVVEYSKEGTFLSDKENIAKITLNRPESLNAFSFEVLEELNKALDQAEQDPEVRAVIITGAGKAFSAGADLKSLSGLDESKHEEYTLLGQETFRRIENFPKGVVAAINGFAFGGGLELSLACDLRVASSEAKMGTTEVLIGLIPAWGGSQRLPYLIGMSRAREMILTGNRYTADEMEKYGLLNKVVPADELNSTAAFLAAKIADNAPLAIKAAKESLAKSRVLSIEDGNKLERELAKQLGASSDLKEGVEAILSKRKPEFKGE
ncbi:MAG: enoyl-CoA hydratase/isomerase family protein [Candidatus Heimdallarchaeota archaeon]|nr:enoyl-CoA hydratase/isomerase family protein [Candidatus Heimdallarchaeota archaeon]MDH5646171.1 enoyl-CoA hydratase/isomerase family protein [Candidatus Heimdallarchaeota archaeon]